MWFLLAAAGAGYLAQRWQNIQKGQLLTLDSSQYGGSNSRKSANNTSKYEASHSDIQENSQDVNTAHVSSPSVSEAFGSVQSQKDNALVPTMDKFTYFEVKTKNESAVEHLTSSVKNISLHECSNDYDEFPGLTDNPLPVQGLISMFSQEVKEVTDLTYQPGSFHGSCNSPCDPCYFHELKLNYSCSRNRQREDASCSYEVGSLKATLGSDVPGRMHSESNSTGFSRREMLINEASQANSSKCFAKNSSRRNCTVIDRQEQFLHHRMDTEIITSPSARAFETNHDNDYEALVGYGLSMAMLFMVSSARKEIEKMETILQKTDDMVSDMKSELDERNSLSHNQHPEHGLDYEDVTELKNICIDSFHQDDCGDDNESIVSVITEDNIDGTSGISDLEAELEAELELLQTRTSNLSSQRSGQESLLDIQVERGQWKFTKMKLENRILELENFLESALKELHMRDLEINWWKDRVNWLLEHTDGGF